MKNRFIVAIGALAVAVAVGSYALWNNSHKPTTASEAASSLIDSQEPATAASTTPSDTHTDATTPAGTTDNKQGSSDAKTEQAKAVSVPETYTVAEGDTLRTIAKKYYKDPIYSAAIERLNGLDDPEVIKIGQVLNLPRPDQLDTTASAPSPAKSETQTDTKTDKKAETDTDH